VAALSGSRGSAEKLILAENLAALLRLPELVSIAATSSQYVIALLDSAHGASDLAAAVVMLEALLETPAAAHSLVQHGLFRALVDILTVQVSGTGPSPNSISAESAIEKLLIQLFEMGQNIYNTMATDGFGVSVVVQLLSLPQLAPRTCVGALAALTAMAEGPAVKEIMEAGVLSLLLGAGFSHHSAIADRGIGSVILAVASNPEAGHGLGLTSFQLIQSFAKQGALPYLVPLLGKYIAYV
jgi:hypothetical protein